MQKVAKLILRILRAVIVVVFLYVLTICYPQPFFSNRVTFNNISVYSDEQIPKDTMIKLIQNVERNVKKSILYKDNVKQNIFITNSPIRSAYFFLINNRAGGLNFVLFNHSVFLRKSDVQNNRLYGPSGKPSGGDRTLDYYMAHEMTHTLEFFAMPWYTYPINTNWTLEGYSEYIAHGSPSYETTLRRYYTMNENEGAKNYTKMRLAVSYLLEKEHLSISKLWGMADKYDEVLKKALPKRMIAH